MPFSSEFNFKPKAEDIMPDSESWIQPTWFQCVLSEDSSVWSIFLHLVPKLWQIDKYQGHTEAPHMDENEGQMGEGVSVQIAEQNLMLNKIKVIYLQYYFFIFISN